MPTLLKLLRRLPVKEDPKDIATFINRELLPFLQELKDSVQSESDDVLNAEYHLASDDPALPNARTATDSDSVLVDNSVAGQVSWKRAEVTGDVEIPENSNDATIPAFATGFVVESATGLLSNEFVGTTSAQIEWDFSVPGVVTLEIIPGSIDTDDLADIPFQTVLGRDSFGNGPPEAITVHQELDWIGGSVSWIFDGTDDRIDFGDNFSKERTDAFSLGIWFRTTSATAASIIGKTLQAGTSRRGYELIFDPTFISFGLANNANLGTNNIVVRNIVAYGDGLLHFALVTYDGSSTAAGVVIYIDGASVAPSVIVDTLSLTTLSAAIYTIGARDGGANVPFSGFLSNGQIWNRVLTAPEVAEVYNGGVPPDLLSVSCASALQHWIILDENDTVAAGGIADHSTSNIDGTTEGGLSPTGAEGSLAVRGPVLWELLASGSNDFPLTSNGSTTIPSYRQLPNAGMAAMAANTVKANATASSAVPTDFAVGTNTVVGRVAGNIVAAQVATGQIANDAVTDIKLRNSGALSVIGRSANSTGDPADISATAASAAVLRESGSVLGFGTVATAGIANDAITDAKIRNSGALSVIGRSANTAGDPADISAVAASDSVLRESGSVLGFGTIATNGIANDAVTNAKAANMTESTVKGRAAGAGTGDPTDLTIQQVLTMLGTPRAGNQIVHDGVGWIVVDELLTEDFYTFSSASAEGEWNWFAPFGGSFGTKLVVNHPGVVTMVTGAATIHANFASTSADASSDRGEILAQDVAFIRVVFRAITAIDQCNFGVGLCFYDSSAGSGEFNGTGPNLGGEAVAIHKRSSNGNFRFRLEDSSSATDTDTGIAVVADEWVEVVARQTSAGTWTLYINGASVAANISGGPQGSQLGPFCWMDNDHATDARDMDFDLFQIGLKFTNPRFD